MLSYIARRFVLALFTIWAISVLAFVIIQLPPIDFIDTYITERMSRGRPTVSSEQVQALRAQYGADQPKPIQYVRWMGLILKGDFGFTLEYQRPVADEIGNRPLIFQGEAEITFQNETHPAHILDGLGLIGAVLRPQCLHLLR